MSKRYGHFSEEDTPTATLKKPIISHIRERQIKATMGYLYIPIRMTNKKTTKISQTIRSAHEIVEKLKYLVNGKAK